MMRKVSCLRYILTILAFMASLPMSAYDIAVKNADGVTIYYNKWENTLSVTSLYVIGFKSDDDGGNGYSGNVVIPASVEYGGKTYSVTSIGYKAFSGCSGLTSVTIPNSVTYIGMSAFYGCSGLTSVTIDNNIIEIGECAFLDCGKLQFVNITDLEAWCKSDIDWDRGNPLLYANHLFLNGKEIKELEIPAGVKSLGANFMGCHSLTSVTIPNSVTSIGGFAFYGCSGLTSVTIPNSVTSIGGFAFSGCSGLTSVTIPNSVTSIGYCAFYGCSSLTSITVEDGNKYYDSRNNCNAIIDSNNQLIVGCKNTTIPNSVTSIGSNAFSGCSGLTSVTIPNSVTNIGDGAFFGTGWYNNQPDGLVYAGKVAYKYKGTMPNTTSIYIKDGTLGIADRAFDGCSGLTSISFPNSVTIIGSFAFNGCSGLTSVSFPNSVTSIGSYAFQNCSGITSITIPNSVTSIDSYAFSGCSGLTSVHITDLEAWCNISFIDNPLRYAHHIYLNGEEIKNLVIPNSVTSIANSAFFGSSGLTSVTIPNSVTGIGSSAFENCGSLTSITIPNSVTNIGYGAFSGTGWYNNQSDGLVYAGKVAYTYKGIMPDNTSITIKDGTLGITDNAFKDCSGLTSVTIPNSVTSIGYSAFRGCSSLTTIVSEIEKPFIIESENYNSVFSDDTYIVAELIVPYGTKAAYQATEGWNKFTMITEAADKDEALFTFDGITYEGTKSTKSVEVKSVDQNLMSVEIPATVSYDGMIYQVTGVADNAFNGCDLAALIWNVEKVLPNNALSNAAIGSNFLLYVKSISYVPSSIKNVVVDGTAQTIVLADDGGQFYCPQAFTVHSISYTHNYSMETGGNGKGWETIALPFDVQRIVHSTRGEIVSFARYSSGSNQKPFWLASLSASGFKKASSIQAYEPYIIAMPNNSKYKNDYNLAGDVTFSADNVQVAKTPTFSGFFLPAFGTVPQSSTVYALNVNNRIVKYSGSYDAGSRFISNLRDVRPFEAYINDRSTRGAFEISFDDGMTDMDVIILSANEIREVTIYTLSGQQITRIIQRDFDHVWNRLPKGVYIVNGKKRIK